MPPPTRANNAIEEAPTANAWSRDAFPGKTAAIVLRPRSPNAATESPITAPPSRATNNAFGFLPVRAACAVRTFASVAARIPQNPARSDRSDPAANAPAAPHPMKVPMRMDTTKM